MSVWRRLYAKPAGSLPGGLITQWGVGITAIFVLLFLTWWIFFGEGEGQQAADGAGAEAEQAPARSFTGQMAARVKAESERAEQRRLAAERALEQRDRQQRQQAARGGIGGVSADEARIGAGPSPDTGEPYTEEEWKLRERLRLEAIERRSRSLRSAPVAQTYRQMDRMVAGSEAQEAAPARPDRIHTQGAAGLQQAVDPLETATTGLPGTPPPGPSASAPPAPARDDTGPPRLGAPQDPPGWERIHEGSFLEAALVTQLSGDFPGPVLAVVSVPFHSADRQRILVPRGARAVGTAQAVAHRDQSRLAVSFHRLIYPDGRWVSLEFHGLNQVGEGALKDRVNRHYLSMFTAVGAIGVLSGLTLRGSNPYAGGMEGFRAGAGQGLGQAATQILQRFLNRLPTITIRAGHRLRIWFTSDVLVPRPTQGG